jgi:hypothetical protein
MTRFLAIDERRFPLITFTQTGVMDDQEYDRYLNKVAEHLAREKAIAYVYHFAHAQRPPAGRVARQAEFVRAHREELARHCVGIAFVFGSPIFRFAISSFLLMQPLPMPYEVCGDMARAVTWAERRLLAAGVGAASLR